MTAPIFNPHMQSVMRIYHWLARAIGACALFGALVTSSVQAELADNLLANPRGVSNLALVNLAQRPTVGTKMSYDVLPSEANDRHLSMIARSGGGFVRLVVNPLPLLSDDDQTRSTARDVVLDMVDRLNAAGLGAIVDLHHWTPSKPEQQSADLVSSRAGRVQLLRALSELAIELIHRPSGRVGLELLNEPGCRRMIMTDWGQVQVNLYLALRKIAPRLPLVVTACAGSIDDLLKLDVSAYRGDSEVIYTFHFYEPYVFTYQTEYWAGATFRQVPFPAKVDSDGLKASISRHVIPETAGRNPGAIDELSQYLQSNFDSQMIARRIAAVGAWADSKGIVRSRILLGEFGTIWRTRNVDTDSLRPDQLRWLAAVTAAARKQRFAFSFWPVSRPGMYNYDAATGFVRPDVLRAIDWTAG